MNTDATEHRLRALLGSQYVGVLTTAGVDGQPYPNLVAFAVSEDLRTLVFGTPRSTRKYENMKQNSRVALLVDNRANEADDTRRATVVTAIGQASELTGEARERWLDRLLQKHPHLADFLRDCNTALLQIEAEKYAVVTSFQDVTVLDV